MLFRSLKEAKDLVNRHLNQHDLLCICVQADKAYEFELTLNERVEIKSKYCPSVNGMVNYITTPYHGTLYQGNSHGVSAVFPTCDFDAMPKDRRVKVTVSKVNSDIFIRLSSLKKSTNTCSKCGVKMKVDKDTGVSHCVNEKCTGNIIGILSYLERSTLNEEHAQSLEWSYSAGKVHVHSKTIGKYLVEDVESLLYLITYECPGSLYSLRVKRVSNSYQLNGPDQISMLFDLALKLSDKIKGMSDEDDSDDHINSLNWESNIVVYSDKYYDVSQSKFIEFDDMEKRCKSENFNINGYLPVMSYWNDIQKLDDPTEFMVKHQSKVRFPLDIEPFVHGGKIHQSGPTYPGIRFYIKATDENINDIIEFLSRPHVSAKYVVTEYDLLNDEVELKVGKA